MNRISISQKILSQRSNCPNRNLVLRCVLVLVAMILATPAGSLANEPKDVSVPQKQVVPFLKQHCLRCHNEEEQNGDFRIDTLAWTIKKESEAESWQEILDVVNAGEMPPDTEPQPSDEKLVEVIGTLTNTLTQANKFLSDAGTAVPLRRLNKREYINSIRHLFGLNLNGHLIPDDLRGDHFDTLGESQFFDVAAFDQYLDLGKQIASEGLRWSTRPYEDTKTQRVQAENRKYRKGLPKKFADLPKAESGKYLIPEIRATRDIGFRLGPDPRASYRVRIHAGLIPDAHPLRQSVTVAESSGVLGVPPTILGALKIRGTVDAPQTEELLISRRTLGPDSKASIGISESKPSLSPRGYRLYLNQIGDKTDQGGTIWVDWHELEGPIYASKKNVLRSLINKTSKKDVRRLGAEEIRKLIERFATEAFRRRKPKPEYVDALLQHYEGLVKEKVSQPDALADTLGIVLASPGFLYLEEDSDPNSRRLSPRSFATRLAYFLWSAPPDKELYQAAQDESIFKPEVLRQQMDRMLDDPKSESFFEGFMSQWAELDRLDGVTVNLDQYPNYNAGYKYSIGREAIEFFKVLVRKDLSVGKLIDSDFVVVNAFLADHYGLPEADYSNEFTQVALPKTSPRGGLITQAGFLTMGSDGNRTSPVIRGALLLDRLLNMPPPSPPPNVPELASASDVPVSNRQIVELHQKQTACASCHKRMDPLGFGLENFDVVGQWRDAEQVGKRSLPIDPSATLISGVKFENLEGLKALLMSQQHRLATGMVKSLLAYGLGRENSFLDQESVQRIVRDTKKNDYPMRDLIFGVINSEPFQSK